MELPLDVESTFDIYNQTTDNTTYINEHVVVSQHSPLTLVVGSILYVVVALVGIVGNASVIWICSYRPMRLTVMNLYILNMAIADLLFILFESPDVVQFLLDEGWQIGTSSCKIIRFSLVCSLYASIMSLLAVSIERYVAILYPIKAQALLTRKRIILAILLTWIISVSCASTSLFKNSMRKMGNGKVYCVFEMNKDYSLHIYYYLVYKYHEFVLFFLVPLIVQLVLYQRIIRKLLDTATVLKVSREGETTPTKNGKRKNWGDGEGHFKSAVRTKSRRHAVRMLVICVCVYFVSYTPAQIQLFVDTFSNSQFFETWVMRGFLYLLACINSAANPVIYCICSETYRNKFKTLYGCSKQQRSMISKTSLRSGESMRTGNTSSFRTSHFDIYDARESHALNPLTTMREIKEEQADTN